MYRMCFVSEAQRSLQRILWRENDNDKINNTRNNFGGLRLPSIEIAVFNGDYNSWLEFRDTFDSLIHNNSALSNIQKYHYLRAFIGTTVQEIVSSLEFSGSNYEAAWELICNRYNNNKALIQNHVKALFNIEKIHAGSAVSLRKMADGVAKHLRALNVLKEPTDSWDTLIIHLMMTKLDNATLVKWEEFKTSTDVIDLKKMYSFLNERALLLESLEENSSKNRFQSSRDDIIRKSKNPQTFAVTNATCSYCKGNHFVQSCSEFSKLSVSERGMKASERRLCFNCLRPRHMTKQCRSSGCKICNLRHHTLLHRELSKNEITTSGNSDTQQSVSETVNLSSCTFGMSQVLLATVSLRVFDSDNKQQTVRALLDAGSQSSFMSEDCIRRLRLPLEHTKLQVSGLNEATSNVRGKVSTCVQSKFSSFSLKLTCLVVPTITSELPNFKINKQSLKIPRNINLADENFHLPEKIDMLLGSDCFWEIMCVGQIKLGKVGPFLQKTKFGWIVSGRVQSEFRGNIQCNLAMNTRIIDQQLSRFWEIEEFPNARPLSREEEACEKHFQETIKRDENGHFIVSIPFKDSLDRLGESYDVAKQRFLGLERRFKRDDVFKLRYNEFMREYESLGHMSIIQDPREAEYSYYIPHHGVIKESSTTTKLRVVFDASCPTTKGCSLNDLQMIGPTIQPELFTHLLRFRSYNYVIVADIEKMYRMCFVSEAQRSLQRILWRENDNDKINVYNLNTVTYGTAAASFLAIRCLQELGINCRADYPIESEVILKHFYVDDMLSGAGTVREATNLANNVTRILGAGGFKLRKWISNDSSILRGIESNDRNDNLDLGSNENTKTLGVIWNGGSDSFLYNIGASTSKTITKRIVLSEVSQIFDPLGLASPAIILAKILLRDIWSEGFGWDVSLSQSLHSRWLQFRNQLHELNSLKIERRVICKNAESMDIHGFSDASGQAYGACVYMKSLGNDGSTHVKLICAKSRVAPLKIQSIPRLELLAALLLARLVTKVRNALNTVITGVTFWTDSTIVLGWLACPLNNLQIFVANRVAAIQELSSLKDWRHVPTADNPADIVSRGATPSDLLSLDLYWSGPRWLTENEKMWPSSKQAGGTLPELRKAVLSIQVCGEVPIVDWSRYSNLTKLERIMAYCCRFVDNCRRSKGDRNTSTLSANEIKAASLHLVRFAQQESFPVEIKRLRSENQISPKSILSKLCPFVGHDGVLRVGGRLSNSSFKYEKMHPAVLCSRHRFTRLLFAREHVRLLHAGPQLLLASLRERYWPMAGRDLARKILHECMRCFKTSPRISSPLMGNLPNRRLSPAPPFHTTGVDYAGPFQIKDRQGRGCKVTKAYICLFVCFVTKAIHLELVSDLTKEAFIAALKRFISRRGKPARVYSDNGTNFVGANFELKKLGEFLNRNSASLTESIENCGISWSFIPAHSPHFGGLWEAGIKSTKHHLKRVAGNAMLTFEQFYTLLTQIESVLNSRPLCPLSNDPSDLTPLTPSHFLIGRPTASIMDPDFTEIAENRLKHYQRVQQLQQHFWARWHLEYIAELQQRFKWTRKHNGLHLNLVMVKEDNLPPFKWMMGRVVQLHPGSDGIARVATIRTSTGMIKRSFAKLCSLPSNA